MKKVTEIGDIITLNSFSYTDIEGGTGMSNWEYNPKFERLAKFEVIKTWNDYECGQRGWAIGNPSDKELMKYIEDNVKSGQPSDVDLLLWEESEGLYIIFWSKFDIIN